MDIVHSFVQKIVVKKRKMKSKTQKGRQHDLPNLSFSFSVVSCTVPSATFFVFKKKKIFFQQNKN